jgi:hypothetical protein
VLAPPGLLSNAACRLALLGPGLGSASMAATNKCLAQNNKSGDRVRATKRYQPEGDVRTGKIAP